MNIDCVMGRTDRLCVRRGWLTALSDLIRQIAIHVDRITRARGNIVDVDPAHGRGRGVAEKSPQLMKIVDDDVRVGCDC